MSRFFASRWVERPDHVTELDVGLAQGFRAAGASCGLKQDHALDVGLLVSDEPHTTSAARFTRSGTLAAPVLLTMEDSKLDALRAVVVNSGNANAATGAAGLEAAATMQTTAARALGTAPETVAVASTGVIGVPLPIEQVVRGIADAAEWLSPDGDEEFAQAIKTTDAFDKRCSLDVTLAGGTVRLSAQAKGAGMISPGFATLLVFVQTDARLEPATADLLLGVTVKRSFERVSVDGQLSTSDTIILQCSGASDVTIEPETEDELHFGEALDATLRQLALMVVRDGEGARRVGRVLVHGGHDELVARAARAIGNSQLVKTALYGGDPNWGRIAQAVGAATAGMGPVPVDISIEGVQVCSGGAFVPHDADALKNAVQRDEVEYEVGLPGEGADAELFFSDLGHEYVKINAEYTT